MEQIARTANKSAWLVKVLRERAIRRGDIIPFPEVSRVLSWYHFRKVERDMLLYELRQSGLIELVPYHGIKILDGCTEAEA